MLVIKKYVGNRWNVLMLSTLVPNCAAMETYTMPKKYRINHFLTLIIFVSCTGSNFGRVFLTNGIIDMIANTAK